MFNISQAQVRDVSVTCQVYHFQPRSIEPKYRQRVENFLFEYLGDERTGSIFGGREAQIEILNQWLNQPLCDRLFLGAPAGRGKSALLAQWSRSVSDFKVLFLPVSVRFDTCREDVFLQMFAGALADALAQDFTDSPVGDTADYYRNIIESLFAKHKNQRLLIVIDGLDEAKGWTLKSLIPAQPSAGLKFIVSARLGTADRDAQGWLRVLNWHRGNDYCQVMSLPILDKPNIARLLADITHKQIHSDLPANLDTVFDDDVLIEQIYRLSCGEPLLVKFYIEHIIEHIQLGKRIESDSLSGLAPGYNGYFSQWFAQQEELADEHNPFDEDSVLAFLALLAHACGPIQATDMKQLLETMLPDTAIHLPRLSKVLRRFIIGHGNREGYALSHPALAQFLISGEADFICSSMIELAGNSYIRWGELQLQKLEQSTDFKPAEYLIRHYCTHLIERNADSQKLTALLEKPWYDACFELSGSHKAFADDVRRIREKLAGTEDNVNCGLPNHFTAQLYCNLILSSIHSLNTAFSPKLCGLGLRDGLFSQNQVFELIRQFPDDKDALSALEAAAPYFNEQGVEKALTFWLQKASGSQCPASLLRRVGSARLIGLIEQKSITIDPPLLLLLAEITPPQQYDELMDFICRHSERESLFYCLILSIEALEQPVRDKAVTLFVDMFTEQDRPAVKRYRKVTNSIGNWDKRRIFDETQVLRFVTQAQAITIWRFCEKQTDLSELEIFEYLQQHLGEAERCAAAQRQVDKILGPISRLADDNSAFEQLTKQMAEYSGWCVYISIEQQQLLLHKWLLNITVIADDISLDIDGVCESFSEVLSEEACQSFPEQVEAILLHMMNALDLSMSALCAQMLCADDKPVFMRLHELKSSLMTPDAQALEQTELQSLESCEQGCCRVVWMLPFLPTQNRQSWIAQLLERLEVLQLFDGFYPSSVLSELVEHADQSTAPDLMLHILKHMSQREDFYLTQLIPQLAPTQHCQLLTWAMQNEELQSRTLIGLLPYLNDELQDTVIEYALSLDEQTDIQLLVALARGLPEPKNQPVLQQIIACLHLVDNEYLSEDDFEFLIGKWPEDFYPQLFGRLARFKSKNAIDRVLSVLLLELPGAAITPFFSALPMASTDKQVELLKQIMPRTTVMDIPCIWQYLIGLSRRKHNVKKVVDPDRKNCAELLASLAGAIVSKADPGDYLIARAIEVLVPYLPCHLVNEVLFHIAQLNDPKDRKNVIDNITEHLEKDQVIAAANQIRCIADGDELVGQIYQLEIERSEHSEVLTEGILEGLSNNKKRFNLLVQWLPHVTAEKKVLLLKQATDILFNCIQEESFYRYLARIFYYCDDAQKREIFSFVCGMVNNVEKGQALETMAWYLPEALIEPLLEQCLSISDGYLKMGIIKAISPRLQPKHLDRAKRIVDTLEQSYKMRAEVALIKLYLKLDNYCLSPDILDSMLKSDNTSYIDECLKDCACMLNDSDMVLLYQHYCDVLSNHGNRVYEIEQLIKFQHFFEPLQGQIAELVGSKIDALEMDKFYSLLDSSRGNCLDYMWPATLARLTQYVLSEERPYEMLRLYVLGDENLRMVLKAPLLRLLNKGSPDKYGLRKLLPLLSKNDKTVILQLWLDKLGELERSTSVADITQMLLDNQLTGYYQSVGEMIFEVNQRWP